MHVCPFISAQTLDFNNNNNNSSHAAGRGPRKIKHDPPRPKAGIAGYYLFGYVWFAFRFNSVFSCTWYARLLDCSTPFPDVYLCVRFTIIICVVSLSFIFPHPPEDEKKKNNIITTIIIIIIIILRSNNNNSNNNNNNVTSQAGVGVCVRFTCCLFALVRPVPPLGHR